ncbi:MAG: glycerophosphodiester phosphodiesterase [Thermoplasmatota archaeon]
MLRIGHRGAAFHRPENTMSSFRRALELGVDMIELDVRKSRCGELMVIHDETVDRTTDGTGKVSEMDLAEISRLDAGSGERVPLLRDVMEVFAGRVSLDIEMKGTRIAEPVHSILAEMFDAGSWKEEDVIVTTFHPGELFDLNELLPSVRKGFIFEDHPDMGIDFASGLGAWSVVPRFDLVDEGFVESARSLDLKVLVWTVNDVRDVRKMERMGVDGIVTDDPGLFLAGG